PELELCRADRRYHQPAGHPRVQRCRLSKFSCEPPDGHQDRRSDRMTPMKPLLARIISVAGSRLHRGLRDTAGAAAAELGLVAPFFIFMFLGIVDFGGYMNGSQAIAVATRIGAEYARDSATCKSGVQVLPTPSISTACTTGI